jgi:hypothetical protein
MNNLETSQKELEKNTQISKIQSTIALAFERTGTIPYNIDNMVKDVMTEFQNMSVEDISLAIRNGS